MRIYNEFSPSAYIDSINKRLLADVIMEKEKRKAKHKAVDAINRYQEMTEDCAVRLSNQNHIYKQ